MPEIMKTIKLDVDKDLHEESLLEAVKILEKNGDSPETLLCSVSDSFVAQNIIEKCNVPIYSYLSDKIFPTTDAWILLGNKTLVYSLGA